MRIISIKKLTAMLLALILMCFSVFTPVVFADNDTTWRDPEEQVNAGRQMLTNPGENEVGTSLKKIADILVGVAFALSIIKLTQIGFQFMLGAGKKSKAKESLIPWFVGVLICATYLFFGPWIMEIVAQGGPSGPFDVNL